jgi:uncharacterized protein (TIGR03086 family)
VNPALEGAVELLELSLGYTRGRLLGVRPELLHRRTPCAQWDLGTLLAHMEDALDAFTDAAAGRVPLEPAPRQETRVDALQAKACHLLGAWAAAAPTRAVAVGDLALEAPVLVATAALEITVHGWDVGQATGEATRVPAELAGALSGVAHAVVDASDRGSRFAVPRAVEAGAAPDVTLLSWMGRSLRWSTGPVGSFPGVRPRRGGLAS